MLERRTEDTYFARARCLGDRRILPQLEQRHSTIEREAYDRPSASTVYSELFFSASWSSLAPYNHTEHNPRPKTCT